MSRPFKLELLIVQAIYDKYVPNLEQIATKMKSSFFGRPVCVKGIMFGTW